MSSQAEEPKQQAGEIGGNHQAAAYKPDDIAYANGQGILDEESLPDMKDTEVLDAYGNEEGAEIQCGCFINSP